MTVTFNWTTITAAVAALAGIAGTIITPIWGSQLATEVQGILQGLSAILIAIPAYHATSVTAATAKTKAHLKLGLVDSKYVKYTAPPTPAPPLAA